MTTTIIFDLDGTLVQHRGTLSQKQCQAAAQLGLHRTEADFRPLAGCSPAPARPK